MSYYKIKNIHIKNNKVVFMTKSNNSTAPYKKSSSNIPIFLFYSIGNVYQYNNKVLNDIVNECYLEIEKHCNIDDWYLDISAYRHTIDECKKEIRNAFWKAVDKIKQT